MPRTTPDIHDPETGGTEGRGVGGVGESGVVRSEECPTEESLREGVHDGTEEEEVV